MTLPQLPKEEYLGDGLYTSFDGFHFRLYTERDNGTHEVFLEPFVLQAFIQFAKTVGFVVKEHG